VIYHTAFEHSTQLLHTINVNVQHLVGDATTPQVSTVSYAPV